VTAGDGFGPAVSPLRVFGAMLRYYRTRAGLSQIDLGARIHFSGDQVSKVEMGQRMATGLVLLATACGGASGTSATAGSGGPPSIAEAMNAFSACLGRHGLPGAYVASATPGTPPPSNDAVGGIIFHGYYVAGANPSDPH